MKKRILTILLVFAMVFATSLTCFASDYNPPNLSSSNDSYIIYMNGSTPTCIIYSSAHWDAELDIVTKNSYHNYVIKWTKKVESPYVRYVSTSYTSGASNGGWGTMSQYDYGETTLFSHSTTQYLNTDWSRAKIVDSNQDWYDGSTLVFQKMGLEEVTVQSLEEMTHKVGGVMKTITLCGVGCLALLIGLHLLRKKSVLFLNR